MNVLLSLAGLKSRFKIDEKLLRGLNVETFRNTVFCWKANNEDIIVSVKET